MTAGADASGDAILRNHGESRPCAAINIVRSRTIDQRPIQLYQSGLGLYRKVGDTNAILEGIRHLDRPRHGDATAGDPLNTNPLNLVQRSANGGSGHTKPTMAASVKPELGPVVLLITV